MSLNNGLLQCCLYVTVWLIYNGENKMTDILLANTDEGGEITVVDGFVSLDEGLQTGVYLSLFGGASWFANSIIEKESEKINSDFEDVLKATPPSSQGLLTIEDAGKRNLQWLIDDEIATDVDVVVALPETSKLEIEVTVSKINGEENKFLLNWSVPVV